MRKVQPFSFVSFGGWIVLCELVGMAGSIFTIPQISIWYVTLAKPSFSPPNWVFGPVWVTLYALMGIAAYQVSRLGWHLPKVKVSIVLFAAQLLLNFLWSFIFFGSHNIPGGFIDIAALWTLIVLLVVWFERLDKTASYLMIPYLVWVSFAMVLNYYLWLLNA